MKRRKQFTTYFTTTELAKRWGMNPGSLANWRAQERGPKWEKIGWMVVYSYPAVRAWEKKHR